jgi:hypothetical protein
MQHAANSLLKSRWMFPATAFFLFYALFNMGFPDTVYLHYGTGNYPVSYFSFFNTGKTGKAVSVILPISGSAQYGQSNHHSVRVIRRVRLLLTGVMCHSTTFDQQER